MIQVKSIDLKPEFDVKDVSFLRAEWRDEAPSRFVLVRYSLHGKEQEYGLRLDLDKRIFLDHLPDPETDKLVQEQVMPIWNFVVAKQQG